MKKKFEKLGFKNMYMNRGLHICQKDKNKINHKKHKIEAKNSNNSLKFREKESKTFGEEIETIKKDLLQDISECNAKKEKDIIILIDFNIYNKKEKNNLNIKASNIDSFLDETILILNYYLSINDRFGVLIYKNDYQIICPLMRVDKIDIESFSKDLKNKAFNQKKRS